MEKPSEENKTEKTQRESIKPYVKYSGLAFQMIGALVLAAWGGKQLDAWAGNDKPWFMISLLLLAVISTTLLTILSITKK
ncbi:AtpZ/AtpI family protein [Pontibacter arcticus]|uniref:F0F1-ATPase subunit Ca2+/Mg2+ transporter n=1 Tax=Pontibacter arcticus TaxID=2080288 RepID=A0A364RJC4_9BACT|nr:AtpZ/AtpI family protein [Pontibacter arcticus]RAU84407.1 hypothetical protein DP923_05060 [Pontibacter arcticus]